MQFKIHALWTVLGGRRWRRAGLPVMGGGPAEEAFCSLGGNIPSTGCKYLGLFTESFTTHLFLQPSHPSAFCFRPLRGNSPGLSPPLMWPPDHGPVRWFVCWEEPREPSFSVACRSRTFAHFQQSDFTGWLETRLYYLIPQDFSDSNLPPGFN